MSITRTHSMTYRQPANAPRAETRLLGASAGLLVQLVRFVWQGPKRAPSAAGPSADEIAYRNELLTRQGKLD